jgi:hypothetical protein
MRLVILYGPPGVGKLTVGRALAALTGYRLFHNHLTVDIANALFARNTAAWDRLARELRLMVFTEAVRENVDLILTRAPRSADAAEVERLRVITEPIRAAGGSLLFVQLVCEREVLRSRVQADDRRVLGKLTDPQKVVEQYDLKARLPLEPHLLLDVTHVQPAEAAAQIAAHYGLMARPGAATHRAE